MERTKARSSLGDWIRNHRKERGWSQAKLAMKMRTSPHVTSISDWERGDNSPGARHLLELGHVFGERPPADDEDDEEAADLMRELFRVVQAIAGRTTPDMSSPQPVTRVNA